MFKMKCRLTGLSVALVMVLALLAGCATDPVVAEVDGEKILKSEFDSSFNAYKQQVEAQEGPDALNQVVNGQKRIDASREVILDALIESRLVAKKAKELGVSVTDAALSKEIEETKGYFKTDEEFNEFLKTQKLSLERLTEMIKRDLLFMGVYDKINEGTTVSEKDVELYYMANRTQFDEVTASHILVATQAEADAVKARLDKGEDFAALAKELTIDPSGKENGGSLGTFSHGAMVEPFDKAVFSMKPGEISSPVETQFGFHIIKCEKSEQKTLEQAAESIKSQLLAASQDKVYNEMIETTKATSAIKKYVDRLK